MRLSRCEPRLETVLQTTRRIPETELEHLVPAFVPDSEEVILEKKRILAQRMAEADAAIFARSKKFVFVKKARAPKLTSAEIADAKMNLLFTEHLTARNPQIKERTSFFQRAYSTRTRVALTATAKLIAMQKRLAVAEGEQSTAFRELSARTRVKNRLVARGRTNFVASTDFMANAGGLDPRFLRYKSPRSRQYEIRTSPRHGVLSDNRRRVMISQFQHKRNPLFPLYETKQILRLRRRHFYIDTPTTAGTRLTRVLTTVRIATPARRIPTALYARANIARQHVLKSAMHNFPNRQQLAFTPPNFHSRAELVRKESQVFARAALLDGQLSQH